MTGFHQAALPPGWHLADEATLPGGRTVTGTAARVYNLLAESGRHSHRWKVGRHLAPAGWVPTWVLREPWAGGSASTSWLWRLGPREGAPSPAPRGRVGEGGPLQGITVRFVAGRPAPAEAIDISPGAASPLAPSFAACDDEAYRRELLQAFHSGRLVAALTGRPEWLLWADPAAVYNPRPVLETALSKLGAVLGS